MNLTKLVRALAAVVSLVALAACGGSDGGEGSIGGNGNGGSIGGGGGGSIGGGGGGIGGGGGGTPSTVTISGRVTFDRIPFETSGGGELNPAEPVESPARLIVVEAIAASSGAVLAATTTNTNGEYSVSVPSSTSIFVRAKAQMQKLDAAPTWNFRVLNNTNGDALYALDTVPFDSGATGVSRNLRAASGWGTVSYTDPRAAAPFAILDTVYQSTQLVLSASASTVFPPLDLFWSDTNRASNQFCPDNGDVVSSLYITFGSAPFDVDECTAPTPGRPGIYVLGDFATGNGDTDEFDQHVIAHEYGHYIEDQFARSDSIGGDHSLDERLDLRVAFGEGWGNAFSAMVLNDPVYRDSFQGIDSVGTFNMETDRATAEGWFSEASVSEILWDVFDAANEPSDAVALGFAPIFSVMTGAQPSTDALTSIFPFATALRAANPSASANIGALLTNELIFAGADEFGMGESNSGNDATVLPIYTDIAVGTPVNVCSRAVSGTGFNNNKLGNRKFLRLVLTAPRLVTIQVTGAASGGGSLAASDPDVYVYRDGVIVGLGESVGATETLSQIALATGTHIIEVYDFDLEGVSVVPRCMNVSISG